MKLCARSGPVADFEMYDYPENCVVIDNPPFSIYDHIPSIFTNERPTDFFLFGPAPLDFSRSTTRAT